MTSKPDGNPANILEQIRNLSREFGKQISQGKSPRIQSYLKKVTEEARQDLFRDLLAVEMNFRRSQGESPTSDEYVKRFPQFKQQVRRAFFEPTMGSVDSSASTDGDDQTASLRSPGRDVDALEPTFELPDANRLGDYELIRKLGQGGMGIVYEARHTKTNNRVALKTLPAGGDGQQVNADKLYRFRKEFRRLSEINHPNLVGMQSLEVEGDRWFFTMDLIDGEDFLSYVRPDDQLDEDRLRSCLKQLSTGVLELHRRGIIHRDLKPSNVLVSPEGHVTILDFGLAAQLQRNADMTQTKSSMFAGTPPYAAPEQMFGERTEASDWYAFGTMLFEALAGERPFKDPDPMKLLRMKQEQDPPTLEGRDRLPSDLSALADGLLRREPGLRLLSDAIGITLGLEEETRIPGSTRGSQDSAGSVDAEDAVTGEFEEEEIVLVGREKQLAELDEIKQELLETRQPSIVWVTGKSGEGKSSLIEAFLRPVRRDGEMLVFSGRCYDRESIPLKALDSQIDSLVRFLRSRPSDELSSFLPRDIERLAQLFPILRRVDVIDKICQRPLRQIDEREIKNLGVAAFGDLLTAISEVIPLVMFIDDLQWADAESAKILAQVLRRPKPPRLLFIGSFRSDECEKSPFLNAWHGQFGSGESLVSANITVSPLTESECLDYIQARIGKNISIAADRLRSIFESSRGNPYFLEQLVAGFDSETGQFHAVPLTTIIEKRLAVCPRQATELIQLLAATGKAVKIPELAGILKDSSLITSTLAHMKSERLVRSIGDSSDRLIDTYHDKIRETVLEGLSEHEAIRLHLEIGEFLESRFTRINEDGVRVADGDRVFDLASHFSQAKDSRAFMYHLQAGEESLHVHAMDVAAYHFEHANHLCPVQLESSAHYRLHYGYGRSLAVCNRIDDAIPQLEKAIPYADNQLQRAECHFLIGEAEWKRSGYANAEDNIAKSFAELSEANPKSIIGRLIWGSFYTMAFMFLPRFFYFRVNRLSPKEILFLSQAHAAMWVQLSVFHLSYFLFHTSRGCLIAKCSPDPNVRRTAFSTMGAFLSFVGLWPVVSWMMWRSRRRRNKKGDEYHPVLGIAELNETTFNYCSGKHDQVHRHYLIAVDELARTGTYQRSMPDHISWHSCSTIGKAALQIHHANREIEIARQSNDRIIEAWGKYGLVVGLARTGKIEDSLELARESVTTLGEIGTWTETIGLVQYVKALLQNGNYPLATKKSRKAISNCWNLALMELTAPAFPLFVEASCGSEWHLRKQGEYKAELKSTRFAVFFSRLLGVVFPNIESHSLRVSGRRAKLKGKLKKANKFFDRAIRAAERIGSQYELARTLIDKSMLQTDGFQQNRLRGIELLESLGCVLPDAEVELLGIDREAHHARAEEARERHEAELDK